MILVVYLMINCNNGFNCFKFFFMQMDILTVHFTYTGCTILRHNNDKVDGLLLKRSIDKYRYTDELGIVITYEYIKILKEKLKIRIHQRYYIHNKINDAKCRDKSCSFFKFLRKMVLNSLKSINQHLIINNKNLKHLKTINRLYNITYDLVLFTVAITILLFKHHNMLMVHEFYNDIKYFDH
ncbi:hypothetical protein AGLY_014143 [Aphis glycines]|uniref:Uncharacterized protein n=1 Tax=Aphis glycines TaxID=307491 RepID=A0A6G0T538_APHGL|nr:hypothetical protein AGLY_014143 [Aphis glycines]